MSKDKKKTKQDKPGKQMKQDKEEDKRQFSNNVLVLTEGDKKTLFLPAYLRLAFKKITQLDVHEASGEMSATVILTIYYKGLSPEIVEHIKKNLDVAINNEMFYNLDPDPNRQRNLEDGKVSASDNEKKSEYTVQWRNKFPLEMDCDIFLTPFEVLELSISFALRTITWNEDDVKVSVKMNFMDCPEEDFVDKFSLQESDDFGEYGLAESSLQAKYVNDLKEEPPQEPEKKNVSIQEPSSSTELIPKQKEKKKKKAIKNWQYACFSLKMYRYPFNTVLTIFLPILLLAVITLAIFFQDFGFGGRIASIATLMVAYSAFLPTVRESLPPVPTCMMFDVIVYSMIFTSILCLIRSWIDREMDTTENPYDWTTDPLFLISLALVCLWTFLLIVTLIVHKCIWEMQYNKIRAKAHEKGDFDSSKWVTKECNEYFESLKEKCVDIKQLLLIEQVPIKGPRRLEPIQRTIQRPFLEGDNIIGSASIANSRLLI